MIEGLEPQHEVNVGPTLAGACLLPGQKWEGRGLPFGPTHFPESSSWFPATIKLTGAYK